MTITAYQVSNVLNAYTRQSKLRVTSSGNEDNTAGGKYQDMVSLTSKEANKNEELEKISYNLRDIILKDGNDNR